MGKLFKPSWMADDVFESMLKKYNKAPVEAVKKTGREVADDMAKYIKVKRGITR